MIFNSSLRIEPIGFTFFTSHQTVLLKSCRQAIMRTMHNCAGENRTHHSASTNSMWSGKPKDQHGINDERSFSLLLQVFENQ